VLVLYSHTVRQVVDGDDALGWTVANVTTILNYIKTQEIYTINVNELYRLTQGSTLVRTI